MRIKIFFKDEEHIELVVEKDGKIISSNWDTLALIRFSNELTEWISREIKGNKDKRKMFIRDIFFNPNYGGIVL